MDKGEIEQRLLQTRNNIITRMMAETGEIRQQDTDTGFSEQAMDIDNLDALFKIDQASKHELHQVNNALNRLSCNQYYLCVCCGKTISEQRLLALPYTDRCIDCA
jgi:RNA polymerase-binding transcription factor DksA